MLNRKRILSLGLGLSLLFVQTVQAEILISPLDPTHGAVETTAGTENSAGQAPGSGSGQTQTDVSQEAPGQEQTKGTEAGTGQVPGGGSQEQPGQSQTGLSGPQETQAEPGFGLEPGNQNQASQPQTGYLSSSASYSTKEPVMTGTSQEPGKAVEPGSSPEPGNSQAPGIGLTPGSSQPAAGGQGTGSSQNAGSGLSAGTGQNGTSGQIEVPVVSAQGAILYDVTHDKVLFEKNADTKLYPASITKLMTALLVLENADLNETVTFSKSAVTNLESGAVTLKLAEGDQVSVKDCMYGLLLKSANEVANGLAEHVAGSIPKFADMMNAKAKALGCTNTNFVNPNGLNDPNHYTTCRDMAKIAKAAFDNKTLCEIDSTLSYKFPATKNANQIRTLTPGHKMFYSSDSRYYEGIVGGKTGYTSLAGNTLVTCVEKNGVRLIAVVMKAKSTQYVDTKALLDYGYSLNAAGTVSGDQTAAAKYNRWIQDGGVWRFELADGTQLKNVCVTIDGADYVFESEGRMLTGWQYLNNTWYCFKESGAMVKNGWMQDQNKWFYLGTDGRMVTNSTIDGKYFVGADGFWIQ